LRLREKGINSLGKGHGYPITTVRQFRASNVAAIANAGLN
jgi:hypothetical protein